MGAVPETYYQFVMDYAPYVYVIPPDTPDPEFGRGALAASFAIDFLCEAYSANQFEDRKADIYSKIDALKEIIRAWGLNPEEILTKDALAKGNATVIGRQQLEEHQLHQLSIALKQQLLKEMRDDQNAGRTTQ